jgi:hypothetical protein
MKRPQIIFIIALPLLFCVAGCDPPAPKSDEVRSAKFAAAPDNSVKCADGSCSVKAASWYSYNDKDGGSQLKAMNGKGSQLIVYRYRKSDMKKITTLAACSDWIRKDLPNSIESLDASPNRALSINGLSSTQFTASGKVNDAESTYLYTIAESSDSYYVLIASVVTPKFSENRRSIDDAVKSFTLKSGDGAPLTAHDIKAQKAIETGKKLALEVKQ